MMLVSNLVEQIRAEKVAIECANGVERQNVIRALLELGFPHGNSGYSKKMLKDPNIESDRWMHVAYSYGWGIEFGGVSYRLSNISYVEFFSIINYKPISVDDLL